MRMNTSIWIAMVLALSSLTTRKALAFTAGPVVGRVGAEKRVVKRSSAVFATTRDDRSQPSPSSSPTLRSPLEAQWQGTDEVTDPIENDCGHDKALSERNTTTESAYDNDSIAGLSQSVQWEENTGTSEESGLQRLPGADVVSNFLELPYTELFCSILVFQSSVLVGLETMKDLDPFVRDTLQQWESVTAAIYAMEFSLRWYANFEKGLAYFLQPLVLIDLLVVVFPLLVPILVSSGATIPSWVSSRTGLINLRLLRVLRLQRVLSDMETFSRWERAFGFQPGEIRPYQLQVGRVVLSLFTLLSVASGLIYTTEHPVNPGIPDYFSALYFSLTLFFVGFSEIYPMTVGGKLAVSGSILVGVAVIPAQTASLVEALLEFQQSERERQREDNAKRRIVATKKNDKNDNDNGRNHDGTVDDDLAETSPRQCANCKASCHRTDAVYCYSCGARL